MQDVVGKDTVKVKKTQYEYLSVSLLELETIKSPWQLISSFYAKLCE